MTDVVLYHHVQGLTAGVRSFADELRQTGLTVETPDLFLYPGEQHLFADSSLPDYDAAAAALLTERVLAFLASVTQEDGRAHAPARP